MATPIQLRNERLGKKLVKSFERRNMEAYYCKTKEEAIKKALEIVPEGSSISWGGSSTIRDMGLTAAFKGGKYEVYDRDECKSPEEQQALYRKVFSMDYYVSSANAVSEDGLIVNVDGTGNRVAAITFGPKNVLFVIGLNKVARDEESAIKRARGTAAPINCARFDVATPCHADGVCHDCTVPGCICNYIHIIRNSMNKEKYKIIIVDEDLGF